MRLAAALVVAFMAVTAPASAFTPAGKDWNVPLAIYTNNEQMDVDVMNRAALDQVPFRGKRYRIIRAAAARKKVPVTLLMGVYGIYSGLGTFSDDWFGLDELYPRSNHNFRKDANDCANELRWIHIAYWGR